jgi:hypothetical protein
MAPWRYSALEAVAAAWPGAAHHRDIYVPVAPRRFDAMALWRL